MLSQCQPQNFIKYEWVFFTSLVEWEDQCK